LADASFDLEEFDENAAIAIRTNDAELNRVEFGKVYLVDSLGGTRLDLVGKSDCAGLIDQNLFH
jgi:hypothetical protein